MLLTIPSVSRSYDEDILEDSTRGRTTLHIGIQHTTSEEIDSGDDTQTAQQRLSSSTRETDIKLDVEAARN